MKYFRIMLIIIISLILIFFLKDKFKKQSTLSINNISFKAEVVTTDQAKATGLSKYKKIDNDFVMVFPFETPDYYSFWMKDMKFSIDIIYVLKNRIVQIFPNVPYPKNENDALQVIEPKEKSDTVLEINGGLSQKYKFKKGDLIEKSY